MVSLPSAAANPMPVDVKLLLSENITCGSSFAYGAHQPSATTTPWRRIITLCSASIFASAASRKALIAGEGMPWASGALRGRGVTVACSAPSAGRAASRARAANLGIMGRDSLTAGPKRAIGPYAGGRPVRMMWMVDSAAKPRVQEEALRLSEERFRLLVETVHDYAIFLLDPEGYITSWNAGAERLKLYKAGEIIGKHFSIFYPPEALARGWPEYELKMARAEGRFEDEGWRVRKDGTLFWANVLITALRDSSGELVGFSKITRDLTERRRHEEDLRHSEERFRLMVEAVQDYAIF